MTFEEKEEKKRITIAKIIKAIRAYQRRSSETPNKIIVHSNTKDLLYEEFDACSLNLDDKGICKELNIKVIFSKDVVKEGEVMIIHGLIN